MRIKQILNTAVICLFISGQMWAQNNVSLEIVHKLNGADFSFNSESNSVDDETFSVTRLQYYVSDISVKHDDGTITVFDSLWALVNASSATIIDLGMANIDSVESVSFSVGVGPDFNHLDPAAWPMTHALAPKNPSMHWGWSAGYRFIAMEGKSGSTLGQSYELHALGDANYFENTTEVSAMADNGEVLITIYGNYAESLKDIAVSNGLIVHGETGAAKTILENFRDYVFSSAEPIDIPEDTATGVEHLVSNLGFTIAPNPASNGSIHIQLKKDVNSEVSVIVQDISGSVVNSAKLSHNQQNIEVNGLSEGVYLINLYDGNSGERSVRKVVVL